MNIDKFIKIIDQTAHLYPNGVFDLPSRIYTCVNPYSYHIVRIHQEVYNKMDGLFVDGMTMCWWIKWLWKKNIPRLSFDMSGMAVDLFSRLNKKDNTETIYFIGSRQSDIKSSVDQFILSYPNMNVIGFRNGYFSSESDREQSINDILLLGPSFVVVGMGSPLQEQYALSLKQSGYRGIVFTCGGFLHQSSNSIYYYPKWIDKYNLRAVYRLFHEKGLWGRLFNVLIQFPGLIIFDTLKSRYLRK